MQSKKLQRKMEKKKSNIDKQRIDRGSNLYEEKGNSGFNVFSVGPWQGS